MKKIGYILSTLLLCSITGIFFSPSASAGALQDFFDLTNVKDLVDTHNIYGVSSNPSVATTFSTSKAEFVKGIFNYHYLANPTDYIGQTIGLKNLDTNVTYGPWGVTVDSGSGRTNNLWVVFPNVEIPAGNYEVLDSHPATWSKNTESSNMGFSHVKASTEHHDITITAPVNGAVTSDKTIAKAGDTVTLSVNPDAGYRYLTTRITSNVVGGTPSIVTSGVNYDSTRHTFTMPNFNINIEVSFELIPQDVEEEEEEEQVVEEVEPKEKENPTTGDDLSAYLALGAVGLLGACLSAIVYRKAKIKA